jgi:hypothetical protein
MFCVLVLLLDIVVFVDTVTPSGVGQRKAPCMSLVSEKLLPCWKVTRETELPDIPTAAPIRATADKATYADDGFFMACMRVLKGIMVVVSVMYVLKDLYLR